MSFSQQLQTIRSGFGRTFWVANVIELFERFAYYGSKAVLMIYFIEKVQLEPEAAGWLVGLFTLLLYVLPAFAGAVVDRFGFKRSLLACFAIFSLGYFMIGMAGLPTFRPWVEAIGALPWMLIALVVTAIGGSLIKPSVVGTVARTTTNETKSLGYSIYYMLVNIGGAVGPFLATPVRENLGIAWVLVMSAAISVLLAVATLLFYKEPPRPVDAGELRSMRRVLADMFLVVGNLRFLTFLLIFSGFWAMFWQVFLALPVFIKDVLHFPRFEILETVDAWTIILVTVAATALAKRLKPMTAMTLGFALATASWFCMVFTPPAWAQVLASPVVLVMNVVLRLLSLTGLPIGTIELTPVIAPAVFGLMVFALGESIQAPRYYEYVANLAPADQVGTYMGVAFLPIGIGALAAGGLSGWLVSHYIGTTVNGVTTPGPGSAHPSDMWLVVGGIGVVSTVLMLLYDRFLAPRHGTR